MALKVVFVSGPRRSGKSTIIEQCIAQGVATAPHYLRMTPRNGDKRQPPLAKPPAHDCGVASARWVGYEDDGVYA